MKLIDYRQGTVKFKLPSGWVENVFEDGTAMFFNSENSLSGVLELQCISISKEQVQLGINLETDTNQYVENGYPLTEEVKLMEEDSDAALVYVWRVYIGLMNTSKRRIIMFTYKIKASLEHNPQIVAELNFMRNTIINAAYSKLE